MIVIIPGKFLENKPKNNSKETKLWSEYGLTDVEYQGLYFPKIKDTYIKIKTSRSIQGTF